MNDEPYSVELPGGGELHLLSEDEVDRWNSLESRYQGDYELSKVNDLTTLGIILTQHINIYRAQRALSGIQDETDDEGLATGRTVRRVLKPAEIRGHQDTITSSSKEVRELEKALAIDKQSRERGGKDTVQDYLRALKSVGRLYGVHVLERVQAYEELAGELRWRIRLMENGDSEDRAYHDCTPEGIVKWVKEVLETLEEKDKEWAQTTGKLYVGKV